jgi:hypothetical protein
MTNNEKIKAFKRLLKELGVYKAWMRNRKKRCEKNGINNFFEPLRNKSLQDIINISFAWISTDCPPLWSLLWKEFAGMYLDDTYKTVQNKHLVNKIKEKIKEELEKYEQVKRIQG